jgi:protein gp37
VSTATSIEWTETTWNPTSGRDRISPGCDHCYALTLAKRLKAMGQPKYQTDGDPRTSGPGFGVALHEEVLAEPLRWRKPRKVFVDSMADLSVWVDDWAQRCVPVSLQLRDGGRWHFLSDRCRAQSLRRARPSR